MLKYSENIKNSIENPYNWHIVNFCNSVNKLQIETNIYSLLDDKEVKDFIKSLYVINFDEFFYKSPQFLKILDIIEINLRKIEQMESISTKIEKEIYLLINEIKTNATEKSITKFTDILEKKVESEQIIKKDLCNILDNSINIEYVYNTIIDIVASIYGLLSSLQISDKWCTIVKNNNEFIKLLEQLKNNEIMNHKIL